MLKKSISAIALAFTLAFPAFAQDAGGLKPQGGDVTAEVQLNLTAGSTISLPQIKGRYFLSPTSALRLGFSATVNNSELANDVERTASSYRLALGLEKHLTGTDRLSPYIGAEVFLGGASYDEKGLTYDITNGWGGNTGLRSNSNYGLNLLAGADFYVAPKLFLGVEFGFGFTSSDFDEVTSKFGNQSNTSEGYSTFSAGLSSLGGIRVGYVF